MKKQKAREFWIKAEGHQYSNEPIFPGKSDVDTIDLTQNGEDRWIYTIIQTVNPNTNPILNQAKWLHVIDYIYYLEEKEANISNSVLVEMQRQKIEILKEALEFYSKSNNYKFDEASKQNYIWNDQGLTARTALYKVTQQMEYVND